MAKTTQPKDHIATVDADSITVSMKNYIGNLMQFKLLSETDFKTLSDLNRRVQTKLLTRSRPEYSTKKSAES